MSVHQRANERLVSRVIERGFDAKEERLDEVAVDQAQKEIAEHGTIPFDRR